MVQQRPMMAPLVDDSILLQSQIHSRQADFDRLIEVLQSPEIRRVYEGTLVGLFKRLINPLRHQLFAIEDLREQRRHREAWEKLSDVQRRSRRLMEEAQGFLGGVAIRRTA